MKKLFVLLLLVCVIFSFVGCDYIFPTDEEDDPASDAENNQNNDEENKDSDKEDNNSDVTDDNNSGNTGGDGTGDVGDGDGNDVNDSGTAHTYTAFTSSDKKAFSDTVDFIIPFIPCDEYYVEEYSVSEDGYTEIGVNFYTCGNTSAEFSEYLKLFDSYTYDGEEEDEYGDTWYFYSSGDVMIDISYYYYGDAYVVDVYVYI